MMNPIDKAILLGVGALLIGYLSTYLLWKAEHLDNDRIKFWRWVRCELLRGGRHKVRRGAGGAYYPGGFWCSLEEGGCGMVGGSLEDFGEDGRIPPAKSRMAPDGGVETTMRWDEQRNRKDQESSF